MIDLRSHINSEGLPFYHSTQNPWFNHLQSFKKLQLSFANNSLTDQLLRLWGANKIALPTANLFSISTGISPQAIAFNPFNNAFYIPNQLDGSVTVYKVAERQTIHIQLEEPLNYPSLVDLTIDPESGDTYVIGAFSNQVYRINSELELVGSLLIPNRPISICINTVNRKLYVGHLLSKTVSLIELDGFSLVSIISTDETSPQIVVNPQNGDWFALHPDSNSISRYNKENNKTASIEEVGIEPQKAIINEELNVLVVLATTSNEVLQIDLQNLNITNRLSLDQKAIAIGYLSANRLIIGTEEELLIYNAELELLGCKAAKAVHSAWYVDALAERIYVPLPIENSIEVIELNKESNSPISFSDNYLQIIKDFQHRPIRLEHVKIQFSGQPLAPILKIGRDSTRGKRNSRLISLCKYTSPLHFSSIFEVSELKDEIIDGNAFWEVLLPANQRLSLLLYYSR